MKEIRCTAAVLVSLFLLALAVRLIYNHQLAPHPFSKTLIIDALDEDAWGREIAAGNWLGQGRGVFYRDPLYAYLLGVFYRVFGHDLPGVRVFQAALDALSVVLLSLVACRVFSARAAIISGLLAALYGPFVFSQGLIMKTSLTLALLAAFLWCGLLAAERGSGVLWFVAGIFLGLGLLTRGNFILLAPVAVLMSFLWGGATGPSRRSLQMLLFVAGLAVALLPDVARNGICGGSFSFMVPSAGLNFYHGNNPAASGVHSRIPLVRTVPEHEERDARRVAEEESGRKLGPFEVSSFWMRRGLDFAFHQPGPFLELLGRKALLFWNGYEVPDVYNYEFFSRTSPLLGLLLTFAVIGPLGLTGIVFSVGGNRRAWVPVALVIVFMGSVVGFYVTDRYRLPVAALLIPFAAQALLELVGSLQSGAYRRLFLITACLALSSLLVNVKLVDAAHFLSQSHTLLGNVHYEENRLDQAAIEYRAALEIERNNAMASNNLAFVVAKRGGNLEEALGLAVEAVRLDPNAAGSFDTLAFIYRAMGKTAEAERAIRQAIALDSDDPALRETLQKIRGRPAGDRDCRNAGTRYRPGPGRDSR